MKYFVRIIVIGLAVTCNFSCKKDYTCECELRNTNPNVNSITEHTKTHYVSVTRSQAKNLCVSYQETRTSGGSSTTAKKDCRLL